MATYAELVDASGDSGLLLKVRVATVIAADVIRANAGATAPQKTWAKSVFDNPESGQRAVLWSVLAQNKSATLAQIIGATDAQVQTAVDLAVPLLTG
jgi:hypothetical protein